MSPTPVGTAYVVIRALTKDVKKDIQKGFKDGFKDNKTVFAQYGEDAGNSFSKSFSRVTKRNFEDDIEKNTRIFRKYGDEAGKQFSSSFNRRINREIRTELANTKAVFARYGREAGDEFSRNFSQRISRSVERSLDGGTASTGNTGMTAGRAFGNSFAREAETRMLSGHRATGAAKTRMSARDGGEAGRAYGTSFTAASSARMAQTSIAGPKVDTSQAQSSLKSLNATSMKSQSISLGADISGAASAIGTLGSHLSTLGKISLIPVLQSGLNALSFSALGLVQSLGQMTNTLMLLPGMIGGLLPVIGASVLAFNGMGTAIAAALSGKPEDVEKLNEAMGKLAPSARDVVKEIVRLKEPFLDLKKNVQQGFFENMDMAIRRLGETTLPMLNDKLVQVGRETGGLLTSILNSFSEQGNVDLFGRLFENTASGLESLQKAMQPTTSAMLRLMEASSRFLPTMGDGWYNLMVKFDGFMARVASDGTFERFIQRGIDMTKQWFRIFGDIGVSIGNVFRAAQPVTEEFINMIERGTERMREISGSVSGQNSIRQFFESGLESLRQWLPILQDFGTLLNNVLPVFHQWSSFVMPILQDMTHLLAQNSELVAKLVLGFAAFKGIQSILGATRVGLSGLAESMGRITNSTGAFRGGLQGFRDDMVVQKALIAQSTQQFDKYGQAIGGTARPISNMSAGLAVMESRVPVINKMADSFRAAYIPMRNLGNSARDATAPFGGLTAGMGRVAQGASKVGGVTGGVARAGMTGMKSAAGGLMSVMGGPWGVALAGAAFAVTDFAAASASAKQTTDDLARSVREAAAAHADLNRELTLSDGVMNEDAISSAGEMIGATLDQISTKAQQNHNFLVDFTSMINRNNELGYEGFKRIAEGQSSMTLAMEESGAATEAAKLQQQAFNDALQKTGMSTEDVKRAVATGSSSFGVFQSALRSTGEAGADVADKLQETRMNIIQSIQAARNASPLEQYADAVELVGDAAANASDRLEAFKIALDIATGTDLDNLEMQAKNVEIIGKTAEAAASAATSIAGFTGELDANNVAHHEMISAASAAREALGNELISMEQQGASQEELTAKVNASKQSFIDQAIAMGASTEAARSLADQIYGIPEQTAASVSTPGLAIAIQGFRELGIQVELTPDGKHIKVTDTSSENIKRIEALGISVDTLPNGDVIITDNALDVEARIRRVHDAIYTMPTPKTVVFNAIKTGDWSAAGNIGTNTGEPIIGLLPPTKADGGIQTWTFANGGHRLPENAIIQPVAGPNGLVQWAEASTHGEAFIPLNPAKKARSTEIWLETGRRLGTIKSNADGSVTSGLTSAMAASSGGTLDTLIDVVRIGFERLTGALSNASVGATQVPPPSVSMSAPGASTSLPGTGGVLNELSGAAELGDAPETITQTGNAIFNTINDVVNPAMQGLDMQLQSSKMNVIDPTFQGISDGLTNLGLNVPLITGGQITPALMNMGVSTQTVAQGMINPALAGVQSAISNTGNVFSLVTQGAMVPLWNNTAATILGGYQGTIDPAFQGIMGGLGAVSQSFAIGADNIGAQWSRVREATAAPVRFAIQTVFNNGLIGMWNSVSELLGTTSMAPYPLNFASGGKVPLLPGTTDNKDSVPAMLMPKEYVMSKPMLKAIGGGNIDTGIAMMESVRQRAGKGKVPDQGPAGLFGNIPGVRGYAGGGVVQGDDTWKRFAKAHMFAKSHHGKPYVWGGSIGPDGGTDCSGWVSSVADVVHGGSGLMRQWATGAFPGGGGTQGATGPQGFVAGLSGGLSTGVSTGHAAGTLGGVPGLPNVNIESGGAHNYVAYGGPAVGADHSQFPTRYHLAMAGLGRFIGGGGGGGDVIGMMVSEGLSKIKDLAAGYKGPGIISQVPPAVGEKLGAAINKKIEKLLEEMMFDPGGTGAERWRPMVKRALLKQGLGEWAKDPSIVDRFIRQIQTESGGDPNISQQIVDVNGTGDAAGVGLGQIIPGTFAANRDPSLPDDRRNPWSNINAMVRYVRNRYGEQGYLSIGNGIGYDSGGVLPPTPGGFGTYYNHTGGPEYVLTGEQWNGIFSAAVATARLVDPLRELARSMRDLPKHMEIVARAAKNNLESGVSAGLSAVGNAAWSALPQPVKNTVGEIQEAGRIWGAVSNYIGGKAEAWARGEWPIGSGRTPSENPGPQWMAATLETPLDKVVATNLNIAQKIANGQEDPGRDPAANAIYDIFGRAPIIPDLQRIAAGGPDQWAYAAAATLATFETGFTEPMEAFTHETSQLTEAVLRVREAAIAIGDQVKATNDLLTAVGRLPGAAGNAIDRLFGPVSPIQTGLFSFNPAPSAAYEEAIRRIEEQEAERAAIEEEQAALTEENQENIETTADASLDTAAAVKSLEEGAEDAPDPVSTDEALDIAEKIATDTSTNTAQAIAKVSKPSASISTTGIISSKALGDDKPKGPSTWDIVAGHIHNQRWTEAANLVADTLQKDPREIDPEGWDAYEQEYTNAWGEWKRDAFKEITSPFPAMIGLEGAYNSHIDAEYDRQVAIATEAATQAAMRVILEERASRGENSNKIAENLTVIGTDPEDLAEKVRKEQEIQLRNQNSRYRS